MSNKVLAMIPARAGTERLKLKNLRMLAGKPVIAYAIEVALKSGVFDRVVVNSDHPAFGKVAERYGAEFYLRPEPLGSSQTTADEVVDDFMRANPGDVTAWVNTTSPLQRPEEVRDVVNHFVATGLDSLITVKDERFHAMYDGAPVNFSLAESFSKTQHLIPVQILVYSVMIWRNDFFLDQFARHGHAMFAGKFGVHPVHKDTNVVLKYEEDLQVAEAIMKARSGGGDEPAYDPAADEILGI